MSAKRPWRWEFAKHCAMTTTLPARIADMGTAWLRARRQTGCSLNCWARKRDIAKEKADRCTLPILPQATWAQMQSLRAVLESRRARHFPRGIKVKGKLQCASSAKER